jgi:hypothetical protein
MKRPTREDPAERRLRLAADFEVEPDDVAAGLYGRIFAIAAGVGRKRLGGEDFEGDGIAKNERSACESVNSPVNSLVKESVNLCEHYWTRGISERSRRMKQDKLDDGCGPFGRLRSGDD